MGNEPNWSILGKIYPKDAENREKKQQLSNRCLHLVVFIFHFHDDRASNLAEIKVNITSWEKKCRSKQIQLIPRLRQYYLAI